MTSFCASWNFPSTYGVFIPPTKTRRGGEDKSGTFQSSGVPFLLLRSEAQHPQPFVLAETLKSLLIDKDRPNASTKQKAQFLCIKKRNDTQLKYSESEIKRPAETGMEESGNTVK